MSDVEDKRARVMRLVRESTTRGDDAQGLHELLYRFVHEVSFMENLLPAVEALVSTVSDESIELLDVAATEMFVNIWAGLDREDTDVVAGAAH